MRPLPLIVLATGLIAAPSWASAYEEPHAGATDRPPQAATVRPNDGAVPHEPPNVMEWEPAPTFPQKGLAVIDRTVTPRVRATANAPAKPGAATFTLAWHSEGSPSKAEVYRSTWALGATDTAEFTLQPTIKLADLGPLTNGRHTWTDPSPALNTRNCYSIRAGDGTYWSGSNLACVYAPNPDDPHTIGMAHLRVRVASIPSASTGANVRVRLNEGIPGGEKGSYQWLDATDTPFHTPGREATFMLNLSGIEDLSDITMIRLEVPGDDDLCVSELELLADGVTAFRKSLPASQGCGSGKPFWAWHTGSIDGSGIEVRFVELRNSSAWKAFNPPVFAGTVSPLRPDGASFVGYTKENVVRLIDSRTAHSLKEDASATGSTERRFRNGLEDKTTLARLGPRSVRVQQHLRLADLTLCTVDAHPTFTLTIQNFDANGQPHTGTSAIASTRIESELIDEGIDQNGICVGIPGVGLLIQRNAMARFGEAFRALGDTDPDAPPAGMQYCFAGDGPNPAFEGFEDGGLTLCFGVD